MTHKPPLALRQARLQRIVGPDFAIAVHAEANRVWVTPKPVYKPPPRRPDDYTDYY